MSHLLQGQNRFHLLDCHFKQQRACVCWIILTSNGLCLCPKWPVLKHKDISLWIWKSSHSKSATSLECKKPLWPNLNLDYNKHKFRACRLHSRLESISAAWLSPQMTLGLCLLDDINLNQEAFYVPNYLCWNTGYSIALCILKSSYDSR